MTQFRDFQLTRPFSPFSLQDVLTHSSILGEYLKKSEQFIQLNRVVIKCLKSVSPELSPYCRVKSFTNNILTLSASSPIWGHSLRFKVPELLETLRKNPNFYSLKSIQTKVEALDQIETEHHLKWELCNTTKLSRLKITARSAAVISETAKGISAPKLQQALFKLASRS